MTGVKFLRLTSGAGRRLRSGCSREALFRSRQGPADPAKQDWITIRAPKLKNSCKADQIEMLQAWDPTGSHA